MRSSIFRDGEVWSITQRSRSKIVATETKFLKKIEEITRRDIITDKILTEKLKMKSTIR